MSSAWPPERRRPIVVRDRPVPRTAW